MPVTSTTNAPGMLTPTYSKTYAKTAGVNVKRNLDIEKRKVEARKKGQLRAFQRL